MKRILILATDDAINGVLRENISSFHLDVKALNDPARLTHTLAVYKPDILLIDFFLEDINGGAICHQLKCNAATRNLPVILLTEYPELISFSRKFGCNAAVSKPVDVEKLLGKIFELTAKNNDPLFVPAKATGLNHKKRVFQH